LRRAVAWSLFGLLRLFVNSHTRPGLPPSAVPIAALTASPRSVSASAPPPGLRAACKPASAAATSARVDAPFTFCDSRAFGDGAPGRLWLKAASTIGSPGCVAAITSSVTNGLY
jgi:hypothetical protein